jgi:D-alanine-D-alanine ligase
VNSDYTTKNNPKAFTNHCPADLPEQTAELIRRHAQTAHRALGCTGYSRGDFVVAGDQVWWLETNTPPGLSATGNMATMAAAAGVDYDGLITFILSTALTPGDYRP